MQLQQVKISRDEKACEVAITAEIPAPVLAGYRDEALKEMRRDAALDGFRRGHAPIERIVQIYGESAILRHAAEHAIQHELPELLATEKLLVIESPRVSTDVPEIGKALKFSAKAALAPRLELADYKTAAAAINANKEEITVSDKDHEQAMIHLRRERHRIDKVEAGAEPQKAAEESRAAKPEELPPLDDAFVQSLGYEDAAKFSDALRQNIKTEKELQAREKRRAEILDELVKHSTIRYPALLREYELEEMQARMESDLQQLGLTFDAYLTQVKKTREQVRADWTETADKRAKVRLILAEIGRKEHLEADREALHKEVAHAKEHYPQAREDVLHSRIAEAMRNEKVLRFLEERT